MKKISRVAKLGRIGGTKPALPVGVMRVEGTGGGTRQMNLLPEQVRVWARRIGDKRAKEVWRLTRAGVQGTLPELLTYAWLQRRNIAFEFQTAALGGRQTHGGAVLDFLVSGLSSNGLYAWRVHGEYWHTGPDVEEKDFVQACRLLHIKVGGVPIVAVVDLWENDVYDRSPEVFEKAEVGMGLRN